MVIGNQPKRIRLGPDSAIVCPPLAAITGKPWNRTRPKAPASMPRTARKKTKYETYHETRLGRMVLGDSLDVLSRMRPKSVDLIVTSPPFGLVRKKDYGNVDADKYVEWFTPFGRTFKRVLKDSGSLVIDIGGSWVPGQPTRSLYHYKLVIALCEEVGFHLAQELHWWNPAKLPTPAEWVTVRRIRVKDAVNTVWWLSSTPWPKASNRRVLQPYSESMQDLLENGYRAKKRPSGHDISTKFGVNNRAAIPPNLIAIAHTESNSRYLRYCRDNGLRPHPARFPSDLPEFFVRMLTDKRDLVIDPFAGSCVTGEVCERLGRRWRCIELEEPYLKGAMGRFQPGALEEEPPAPTLPGLEPTEEEKQRAKPNGQSERSYKLYHPSLLWNGVPTDRLPADGGKARKLKKKD